MRSAVLWSLTGLRPVKASQLTFRQGRSDTTTPGTNVMVASPQQEILAAEHPFYYIDLIYSLFSPELSPI